jgi:hypothetical protein
MAQKTCNCDAYPFPHRKGGGKCNEDLVCKHGHLLPDHPDYDPTIDRCPECSYWERVDWAFDTYYDR